MIKINTCAHTKTILATETTYRLNVCAVEMYIYYGTQWERHRENKTNTHSHIRWNENRHRMNGDAFVCMRIQSINNDTIVSRTNTPRLVSCAELTSARESSKMVERATNVHSLGDSVEVLAFYDSLCFTCSCSVRFSGIVVYAFELTLFSFWREEKQM